MFGEAHVKLVAAVGTGEIRDRVEKDAEGARAGTERRPWLAATLGIVGLVSRVAPLADRDGRLLRQFPTEDGYLMLTIARNLALGHGMSTADGTAPTNGTQPLATFLWAACALAAHADRFRTVAAVLVLELLFAIATAVVVYLLARVVLGEGPRTKHRALLAAAGWFACETIAEHSMNCLESGLYALLATGAFLVLLRGGARQASPRWGRWIAGGAILGVAFWARNDVVLLCAAVAVSHLVWGLPGAPERLWHRFLEVASAGVVVALIAAPWVIFNTLRFGHPVPVSGRSESLDVAAGENLGQVGRAIFGYATLFLPIPVQLSQHLVVEIASLLGVAVYAWLTWSAVRRSQHEALRRTWIFAAVSTLFFSLFYGLFFGAPYFVSRYFLVLTPFYAIAWGAAVDAARDPLEARWRLLPAAGGLVVVALAVGLNLREYRHGAQHQHFQVASWVEAHVPPSVWVGAPQSGTVGYFHDRTLNLDGKVNPSAFEARRDGRLPQYIIDGPIEYIADWEPIASPVPLPGVAVALGDTGMSSAFEVIVDDHAQNLAVLRRIHRPF